MKILERKSVQWSVAVVAGVMAVMFVVSACGDPTQRFNDAPKSSTSDRTPADVISFPDGFSNVATKCNNGNRVYVAYHGTGAYGSVSVVPNDPTCAGS